MIKATIATHKGAQYSPEHNRRVPDVVSKEKHIDLTRPHECWIDKDVRSAFDEIFGDSVRGYNENQKRADRKIINYYDKIAADKRHSPVQELIIGVYYGNYDPQTCREILRKFVDSWEQRNPSLKLIGAYYHADERSERGPHVHLDYIPVGMGYQRGMKTQCSQEKALNELGFFSKGKRGEGLASTQWIHRENGVLEGICCEHGIEVIHPRTGDAHLKTSAYISVQQKKDKAEKAVKMLSNIIESEREEAQNLAKQQLMLKKEIAVSEKKLEQKRKITLQSEALPIKPEIFKEHFGKVTLDKDSYEKLQERSRLCGDFKQIAIERTAQCDRQNEKIKILNSTINDQ